MLIESIIIDGLKGGRVEYALAPIVLIEGPNGAGKSRIMDAIRFLFGGEPAGVSADGRSMADLLSGDRLFVQAVVVDGGRQMIISRERVVDDGTFKRSVIYIDGEIVGSEALPSVRFAAGRPLVHASEDVTAAELARIGASRLDPEPIDLIERATEDAIEKWSARPGEAGERIDAVFAAVKAETKRLRGELREATASAERSRRDFGTVHIQIGEANRWAGIAEDARERVATLAKSTGAMEAQVASIEGRRRKIEQQLAGREDAVGGDVDRLRAEYEAARDAHRPADARHSEAAQALAAARKTYDDAERTMAAADDRVSRIRSILDRASTAALQLDGVPCRRGREWVLLDDVAANPLVEGEDICGTCPLSASARSEEAKIEGLQARLDAAVGEHAESEAGWSTAATALREAKAEADEAAAIELSLRRVLESATRDLRRAETLAGMDAGFVDELRAEYAEVGADHDRLTRELREAKVDLEKAVARRLDASTKAKTARVAEERLRRLRSDEALAGELADRMDAIRALADFARRVRARFIAAGLDAIRGHGGRFVEWMHGLDVDGRVGVRDAAGRFWSGPALSAAQAELVGTALDVAIARIDGAAYRPVMVEADPLDGSARAAVLEAIEEAMAAGDVTQAFVASWLPIQDAPPSAVRVEVKA